MASICLLSIQVVDTTGSCASYPKFLLKSKGCIFFQPINSSLFIITKQKPNKQQKKTRRFANRTSSTFAVAKWLAGGLGAQREKGYASANRFFRFLSIFLLFYTPSYYGKIKLTFYNVNISKWHIPNYYPDF